MDSRSALILRPGISASKSRMPSLVTGCLMGAPPPGEMCTLLPLDASSSSEVMKDCCRITGRDLDLESCSSMTTQIVSSRPLSGASTSSGGSQGVNSNVSTRHAPHVEMWSRSMLEPSSPPSSELSSLRKPLLDGTQFSDPYDTGSHAERSTHQNEGRGRFAPQHPLPPRHAETCLAAAARPPSRDVISEGDVIVEGAQSSAGSPPSSPREPRAQSLEATLRKLGGALGLKALCDGGLAPPPQLSWPARGLIDSDCEALEALLCAPGRLAALSSLNLAHNALGDAAASALGRALRHGAPLLRTLMLHENHIGSKGMADLATAFVPGSAGHLECLRLNFNRIGDEGLTALARAWSRDGGRQMSELHLVANGITDAGVKALAVEMYSAPLLCVLSLGSSVGGNDIGDEGALALAAALRQDAGRPIVVNLLCNRRITRVGAEALMAASAQNRPGGGTVIKHDWLGSHRQS